MVAGISRLSVLRNNVPEVPKLHLVGVTRAGSISVCLCDLETAVLAQGNRSMIEDARERGRLVACPSRLGRDTEKKRSSGVSLEPREIFGDVTVEFRSVAFSHIVRLFSHIVRLKVILLRDNHREFFPGTCVFGSRNVFEEGVTGDAIGRLRLFAFVVGCSSGGSHSANSGHSGCSHKRTSGEFGFGTVGVGLGLIVGRHQVSV